MVSFKLLILLLFVNLCFTQQQGTTLPVTVSPAVVNGTGNGACPPRDAVDAQRDSTKVEILNLLENTVIPILEDRPCGCGGPEWTKIAYLDMTDPSQQCPTNWTLNTFGSIRGCGQTSPGGNSAFFSVNGSTYSHVCGKIVAYQKADTESFGPSFFDNAIEITQAYMDGLSLTHGPADSRQHIWSFASAAYDVANSYNSRINCRCTNINEEGTYPLPDFVGNDYFCDTGNPGPGRNLEQFFADDPLWDGAGCPSTSTCCQFNTPPYFCKALPQSTSDDIEIRLMLNAARSNEDVIVSLLDMYVQ